MQLIIDVGNTKIKLAVFRGGLLLEKRETLLETFSEAVVNLVKDHAIEKAIISSVGRLNEQQMRTVQNRFPTVILGHRTPMPFENAYKTPETLGVDRLALVSAFAKAYPNQNGLIIDAGTCITYDFINAEGIYKGGAISPGLRLRYASLHNFTANLPYLETSDVEHWIGNTTEGAIHSGVFNGTIQEIDGVIVQYKEEYNPLVVILTGGDADVLSKRLKNSIFAHSNFLLEGLNYILKLTDD